MLITPSPLWVPGGGIAAEYLGYEFTDGGGSAFYYPDAPLGDPHTDRVIIVGENKDTSTYVTSVTVGGESATRIGGIGTSSVIPSIWMCPYPSGTTADIYVYYYSSTGYFNMISVWRVNTTQTGAYDSDYTASAEDPATCVLSCPAGGVIIGMARNITLNALFDWTNLDEDYDTTRDLFSTDTTQSGASRIFTSEQTDLTITADPSLTASSRLTTVSIGP